MDDLDEIIRRMQISTLRVRLELCEVEIADLDRTVESSATVALRRESIANECIEIMKELEEMQPESFSSRATV
jgi:hypothetical protein